MLIVDETAGVDGDADDTLSASVIALFNDVNNAGTDPDMPAPEYAAGSSAVATFTANFGADGEHPSKPPLYSLEISVSGVFSGLQTTELQNIYLFSEEGGKYIVGRFDAANGPVDSSDPAAFAIHVDPLTGVLSVVVYVSLHHDNTASHDEPAYLDPGVLAAKVTVTDGDNDTASVQLVIT
jgi:hypothetical protein